MLKKILSLLICIALLATLIMSLVSCGDPDDAKQSDTEDAPIISDSATNEDDTSYDPNNSGIID